MPPRMVNRWLGYKWRIRLPTISMIVNKAIGMSNGFVLNPGAVSWIQSTSKIEFFEGIFNGSTLYHQHQQYSSIGFRIRQIHDVVSVEHLEFVGFDEFGRNLLPTGSVRTETHLSNLSQPTY